MNEFDEVVEDALSTTLGGPIAGLALDRATCGVNDGGLGLRRGAEIRLAAFIASRTESRGLAFTLAASLPAGLRAAVFARWNEQVCDAMKNWELELPESFLAVAQQVVPITMVTDAGGPATVVQVHTTLAPLLALQTSGP